MVLVTMLAVTLSGPQAPSPALPAVRLATPPPAATSSGPVHTGPLPFEPGVQYDAAVPTLYAVVGHGWGQEISTPEQIVAYLKALAAAAPDRTRLVEYARSWEGRPLHVLVISSRERIASLDQARAGLRRLADPRGLSASEADRLVSQLPVVTWLVHGVHGNEISSPESALAQAYHLLAARNDPVVDSILRESVVLIDPLQNPDGRARFVATNAQGRAATPDPEPAAAERDEPWPGGRSNHYLFDMNRDWFAQTQPETRGRTALFLQWFPQVVVDLHEMGGESTYYFAPPADPLNPYITKAQAGWFETFGRANGRAFDARGLAYFTREVFDSFYPGYGESWPIFHGAIGMTYEMASARGLVYRRRDGTLLTYLEGVRQHFVAAVATMATAAANRERLLRDFLDYRRSAIAEGERGPVREYLISPGPDPARSERLARLLARQGIDVRRAERPVTVAGRTLPVGTFVIPAAQPAGRMVRNLLDPHVPQPETFVAEQDRRRRKRLPDEIYDLTAWSLPLAFDVEVTTSATASSVPTTPVTVDSDPRPTPLPAAKVGYLVPWGSGTAGLVAAALQQGLRVRMSPASFTIEGRTFARGTAVFRASDNGAGLAERLGPLAASHGVEVVPIDSAFVESGVSLGSNQVATLQAPRVLLVWDRPAQSLSAGWARYVLERRYGQPVTAVRAASLSRADLTRFDVMVLPAGSYGDVFNAEAVRRIKDWISRGGTLVTLGEATRWAARENVALLETRTEWRDGRPEVEGGDKDARRPDPPPVPIDLERAIQPERERPENTPGALLRVVLDGEHWLAAGSDGEVQAIVEGERVLRPITLDKGRNVGVYQEKDALVAGGLVWPEAQALLARKAYLVHQPLGQGHIVAFAEDPNYRAFTEATQLLFINAVLLGPAF